MTKTKNAVPVLLVLGTFGFSAAAMAADYGSGASAPSNSIQSPATKTISGTVQTVDTVNNSVQVKDTSGMLQTVQVDNSTEISVQGKKETINDLKIGDVVTLKTKNTSDAM